MVEFEPNYLRKTYRLKLPAKVIIEGKEFKVTDWSFEGFGIELPAGTFFEKGQELIVTFVLPFASFNVSFKAKAQVMWSSVNRAGFQFLGISDEVKQIIKNYVRAYIEGKLEDTGEVLSKAKIETVPPQIEQPLSEEEKKELDSKFKKALVIYGILALVVVGIIYTIAGSMTKAYSVEAFYSGTTVSVLVPHDGIVDEVYVREHTHVSAGDPLVRLTKLDSVINTRKKEENLLKEIRKLREKLRNYESERVKLKGKILTTSNQIEALLSEARIIKSNLDNYRLLYRDGYIAKSDLNTLESNYRNLKLKLSELTASLEAYEMSLKTVERNIKDIKFQIDSLTEFLNSFRDLIERVEIKAPVSGKVLSIYKNKGDMVKAKEPLVVIENSQEKGYVIGRFKKSEAEFIKPGNKAFVYFPSLNITVKGKVGSVGKIGLQDESIISESEEYALADVPVKVILNRKPPGASRGVRAEVVVETDAYRPFIVRYLSRLLE